MWGGTPPDNIRTFVRPPTRSRKRRSEASRNTLKEKEDPDQSDRLASSGEPPEDAEPDEEVQTSAPQTGVITQALMWILSLAVQWCAKPRGVHSLTMRGYQNLAMWALGKLCRQAAGLNG